MADKQANTDELALQAYLYAGGELSDADRTRFEQRLAIDQAAREALANAVEMSAALRGEASRPDPAYRDRVRQRLRPSWWSRLLARRSYRGHPLLWTAAGAAASLLLALTLFRPAPEIRVIEREVPVSEEPADPACR
jgi:anti-sigma factor RsiW